MQHSKTSGEYTLSIEALDEKIKAFSCNSKLLRQDIYFIPRQSKPFEASFALGLVLFLTTHTIAV